MNALSILTPRSWAKRVDPELNKFSGLDRLFDVLLDGLSLSGPGTQQTDNRGSLFPKLDIRREDHQYAINLEVPGVEEKDIHIEVKGNELTISGEKRQDYELPDKDGAVQNNVGYYSERSYGSFTRSLTLPEDIDTHSISANYKNGILTVLLPRKEPEKSKSITIEVGKN
jgi:HSP20 family protein